MAHSPAVEELDETESELHSELMARNIFIVTMIGAVGFFIACAKVMMH